ncbi:hypothetical protein MKK70_18790 [Methylobacterium sp. E-041]|jgi:hypothetical protein|uniref:hypothetical protein n=1 Tax=unclassified Methylobacterium TaxID=2615210 RepID=UPI0011C7A229|nr:MULTISPECIES: hypothetical protein [unclassified Methylobacterium]MCJ2006099.1 hypothetical protein [Methylobacterium sp. J-092]MCJ2040986.1 hypothetical protein [Methylobacterium sp. J-059]MCJ2076707.1 hypothetical protein [Methylobacterium sp. E-016]MCJ2107394.1 hypothetical protein [Methylobacterium sp. E-041]MCJ2114155.1 hypothetical protein [Methylobacterium sp. E-025]
MLETNRQAQTIVAKPDAPPTLDALTRQRLGRHLQALYEPVIDEALDPRLAELMRQLDDDRQGGS